MFAAILLPQDAHLISEISGFGWNESKQCVERHPNRYYTPGKPFPLYPRLEFVFERDRATGAGAQDAADAVAQLNTADTEGEGPADPITSPTQFDTIVPSVTPPPTTSVNVFGFVASSNNTDGNRQNKGKRKMRDIEVLENVAASFILAIDSGKENARIIADAIVGLHGSKLGDELGKLSFSTEEVIKIGRIFAKDVPAANFFWDLNEDQRPRYVRDLLDDDV